MSTPQMHAVPPTTGVRAFSFRRDLRKRGVVFALLLGAFASLPDDGHAATIPLTVFTSAFAIDRCGAEASSGAQISSEAHSPCGNSAFANVAAGISAGSIGVAAAASTILSATTELGNALNGDARALASISGGFTDFGIVGGTTGVPVDILVTLTLTGSMHVSNCDSPQFPDPFTAIGTGAASVSAQVNVNGSGGTGGSINGCSGGQSAPTFALTLLGGSNISYTHVVSAFASASNGNATASANAMNTSLLFFDVLTPGVSIVWNSGHDYSSAPVSAVPEPSSLLFLGTGLAGLATRRLRRKK